MVNPAEMNISLNELNHHGILGMKWGIRRFQPYPNGYSGDGKYVGPKPGTKLNEKDKKKLKEINAKLNTTIKESVNSGDKKTLKSLKKVISNNDYKKAYVDLASKAIKESVDKGNVKKLKEFKSDLSKNDYKTLLNKARFNNAINNLKTKKMVKYGAKLSDDDIRNANNRIQNLTNINRNMKSIRTDNSLFMTTADIAKKLGVMIGVTVAAKGAVDKFSTKKT